MIYFDNSATTAVNKDAAETAMKFMTDIYYNPSAAYSPAVSVEHEVNAARSRLASYLNADASEIIFTSGGTESNNMAFSGTLRARYGKGRIITSAVEHPSVFEPAAALKNAGYDVVVIGVDSSGRIRTDELYNALTENTVLVSIMHVNNEVGSINDINALNRLIHQKCPSAVFHVDGVQAYLKRPAVQCDLYSVSGHKLHAPKGIGLLYARRGLKFKGGQLGGGQESGLRSGTENVPSIMALDTAAADFYRHRNEYTASMAAVKRRLYDNLMNINDVLLNGPSIEDGAPYILNMSFLGVRGEVLLHAVMDKGLLVSTGSACSARSRGKNRILSAMGITGERQDGAMRFSFSHFNTVDEADRAAEIIEDSLKFLRRFKRR